MYSFHLKSFCKSDQILMFHSARIPSAIDCIVIVSSSTGAEESTISGETSDGLVSVPLLSVIYCSLMKIKRIGSNIIPRSMIINVGMKAHLGSTLCSNNFTLAANSR